MNKELKIAMEAAWAVGFTMLLIAFIIAFSAIFGQAVEPGWGHIAGGIFGGFFAGRMSGRWAA